MPCREHQGGRWRRRLGRERPRAGKDVAVEFHMEGCTRVDILWQPDFCLLSFSRLHLLLLWNWGFWINSNGLKHLGMPLIFTQVTHPSLTHHSFSENSQNDPRNIFYRRKIFIVFSKTQFRNLCSKATLIFIAPKILRKFPNILWPLAHLPEQKYCITFWNIFATENLFYSGQKRQLLQQVPFSLIQCCWIFLSITTFLSDC